VQLSDWCQKRIRIHMRGMSESANLTMSQQLLSMVKGVSQITVNQASERLLVIYDDRMVEAWQLTALAGELRKCMATFEYAAPYSLVQTKKLLALPPVLLVGVTLRRTLFGRSPAADNLLLFELSTALSVFSGYPELRERVRHFAAKIGVSDDALFTGAALILAVLRESPLVFISLFVLTYSSYRKKDNTLAAFSRAGESLAELVSENVEPAMVTQYGEIAGWIGGSLAAATALLRRRPSQASALLLAASPRPAIIGARYALNYGEAMTHEQCDYIPLHTGMDLYALSTAHTVTLLHARTRNYMQAMQVRAFTELTGLPLHVTHISDTDIAPPLEGTKRRADAPLRQLVLLDATVEMPACHERQGDTLYLRGDLGALTKTIALSWELRRHIHTITWLTGIYNTTSVSLALAGLLPARTINVCNDGFGLVILALANRLHPSFYKSSVRNGYTP